VFFADSCIASTINIAQPLTSPTTLEVVSVLAIWYSTSIVRLNKSVIFILFHYLTYIFLLLRHVHGPLVHHRLLYWAWLVVHGRLLHRSWLLEHYRLLCRSWLIVHDRLLHRSWLLYNCGLLCQSWLLVHNRLLH